MKFTNKDVQESSQLISPLSKPYPEILKALKEQAGAKVTGSYARGEQTKVSDLDIFIPEKHWQTAKVILNGSGWVIDSTAIGQLCSHSVQPRIEMSYRFSKQAKSKLLAQIELGGVIFKTW